MPIKRVFIFCSYARNKIKKDSDLDLCFISSKFKNPWESSAYLQVKIHYTFPELDIPFDIVAYRPQDFKITVPLVYEIKKYGRDIKL